MKRFAQVILAICCLLSATRAFAADEAVTGTVDVGFRWLANTDGSLAAYRSIVNLGQGPKLFGADLTIAPRHKLWDTLKVSGLGWGGDPYTTARVEAAKERRYRFTFDYRDIAYFNALPSFANPLAGTGVYLDQEAYDTRRRMADFSLELRPGSSLIPYLEYSRDSENGSGITDFVSSVNEYPVRNLLRSHTDNYRGGLRVERKLFHVTLEEGAAVFKDDQQTTDAQRENGNLTTPFLGQRLFLDSLLQAYGIRGTAPYSRGLFTATPFPWVDLYGQFQFSQGRTNVNYFQTDAGSLASQNPLLFYTGELDLLTGASRQPHTSGSIGAEVRPFKRLRILENWTTDRLHTSSSNTLAQTLGTLSGVLPPVSASASDRLVDNYNQQSLDLILELPWSITLRGGERYVYGDTTVRAPFAGGIESGVLNRQAAVAGISWRSKKRISGSFDFEGGSSNQVYYRTSLQDYRKYRARARYQPLTSLSLTWTFSDLENGNPIPSVQYTFSSRQDGIALQWSPARGKYISLLGSYDRTSVESNILYVVPQTFRSAQSLYNERANQATAQIEVVLPKFLGRAAKLDAGGSLFYGSGSRPTHFYQPLAKLNLPLGKRADWVAQWQWYGFDEPGFAYEAFRTTVFTTGLHLKL
jgi:hypothetical protein